MKEFVCPYKDWNKSEGIPLQLGLGTLDEGKNNEKEIGSMAFLL